MPVTVMAYPDGDGEQQPSDVFAVGRDWLLKSAELEGHFPVYRDVIPESQSKFVVDRQEFIETLTEVALATSDESKGIRLDLGSDVVRITASAPDMAESTGSVPCLSHDGGEDRIITEFLPALLLDAVKTLPGKQIVIDVGQNLLDRTNNAVRGRAALVYSVDSQAVRWVVMPINIGLEPSRETLGSNYEGDGQAASPSTEGGPESTADAVAEASASTTAPRRRRRVEHVWPEIGTRLDGEYAGETYAALVVAAPKLKAGRALQIINGPALGRVFNSMTAAMQAATAAQRQELGLGRSKKGLPKSGWDFWRPVVAERMSA